MSRGGATLSTAPVGWVFLNRYGHDGITVRWKRGETVAYVFDGKRLGDHGSVGILDKIQVVPAGWADLNDIRQLALRWIRQQ